MQLIEVNLGGGSIQQGYQNREGTRDCESIRVCLRPGYEDEGVRRWARMRPEKSGA